jgi:hypothetical protein
MKLSITYHCLDCQEIFEFAPHGACPCCSSREISSLSWLVKSAAEREAWFERIRGASRRESAPTARPSLRYPCPTEVNTIEPEAT